MQLQTGLKSGFLFLNIVEVGRVFGGVLAGEEVKK
jgi:hypothetical protein